MNVLQHGVATGNELVTLLPKGIYFVLLAVEGTIEDGAVATGIAVDKAVCGVVAPLLGRVERFLPIA